jgi:membrane fusion protein (multidrug efflux system)
MTRKKTFVLSALIFTATTCAGFLTLSTAKGTLPRDLGYIEQTAAKGVESIRTSVTAWSNAVTPEWNLFSGSALITPAQAPEQNSQPHRRVTLSDLKALKEQQAQAEKLSAISPAGGKSGPPAVQQQSNTETKSETLSVEAVLVPRRITVISSSQDGKIADIPFDNGDAFKAGDVLIRYDCADLEAEAEIAGIQKTLTGKKVDGVNRLFKLDIISDVDRLSVLTEDKQARAKIAVYQARLDACAIKAEFDGHVTKRLANPGEYTRTDRVLMETASSEPLQAQFLLPSKWLRWVDVGAPLTITLNETGKTYSATVTRLYGEVDPVSQSIQVVATLDSYQENLLPGMSGKAALDTAKIRNAGVLGFLKSVAAP